MIRELFVYKGQLKNNIQPPEANSIESSKDSVLSDPETHYEQQTKNVHNEEPSILTLDVVLSADCIAKDLRASLIIESLRDICKVFKTNPDEDEIDSSFNGHFAVFLSGDRDKIEDLMDRISEIEKFIIIL